MATLSALPMDIISNQTEFISHLLVDTDVKVIQHCLKNALIVISDIVLLESNLQQLFYAIHGGFYTDCIRIIGECRSQFESYKGHCDKFYLNKLFVRYQDILSIVRGKILNEFALEGEPQVQAKQINDIYELLELLDQPNQQKFLSELAFKICSVYPVGSFIQNYKLQFNNVFPLLQLERYRKLDKWNINKFIIEEWCSKLRESIETEDINKMNTKMIQMAMAFSP